MFFLRGLIGLGSCVDRQQQMFWRVVVSCLAAVVRIAFASQAAVSFLDMADATAMHVFLRGLIGLGSHVDRR
jgi:hypothetical protein